MALAQNRRWPGLLALTIVAALAGGLLAGCGGSGAAGAGSLVLYNGQHPQTTDSLVAAFEAKTGIKVSVRSDDEDVLADQIVGEGSRSPADVIYTENSPALEYLETKHLLARLPSSLLGAVPRRYDSPQGDWLGVTARASVLVYNTRLLPPREVPRTILALGSPRWRGKLAIAPEETDFQPIVTAVARAYGKARALSWLEAVRSNGASHEYADNESITSAVNSGQAELGVINQYYWYRLRAEIGSAAMHSAIAWFAPRDPGYVVDISGAAVLRSSRHKKAAEEFLSFLVSQKGQRIIAERDSFEYPIRPGVAAARGLRPFASLKPYPITVQQLGDGARAVQLMREASLLP